MTPLLFAVVDVVLRAKEAALWMNAAHHEQETDYASVRHLYVYAERACDQVGWWRSTWPTNEDT